MLFFCIQASFGNLETKETKKKKKKKNTVFLPKAANYQQLKLLGLDWSTYALASAYAYVQSSVDETVVQ